jgi:hypothetical protein
MVELAQARMKELIQSATEQNRASGGFNNYYLCPVDHPQRAEQVPYVAECEDLIESLALTPDEANIFKEIWRSANARQGNGKPGHRALYGAEKLVHYAARILRKMQREMT